ncbi:hypothetical protein POV27_02570 [Aureisphaera galaxeae]|uniref:hypothetical protein n=1 Tax=Aureisphaera galaxeae TaxID=1538023 RepID=UPI0023502322|nr:hypothetical protein [Aureisphaera galaxeae]MDC8002926.1 hypothetical protein [Aureisphaera galaxeae]
MGANHNTKRYGELWPDFRIALGLAILEKLKPWVTLSGGWAWHFMSPDAHVEYKHAHDHKDIDIFVHPKNVAEVMVILLEEGFQKVWTRYDHLPSTENFRRYEKAEWLPQGRPVRTTIDFFEARELETIQVDGWNLVAPKTLLSYYSNIHSSDKCWAVKAAHDLLVKGLDPVKNELLMKSPVVTKYV